MVVEVVEAVVLAEVKVLVEEEVPVEEVPVVVVIGVRIQSILIQELLMSVFGVVVFNTSQGTVIKHMLRRQLRRKMH